MGEQRASAKLHRGGRHRRLFASTAALAAAGAMSLAAPAFADEGGVSFWVSGIYASLAAVPLQPGWTVNETYYHWQGQAGADVAAAREVTIGRFNPSVTLNLSGNLNAWRISSSAPRSIRSNNRCWAARRLSGYWPLTAAPMRP